MGIENVELKYWKLKIKIMKLKILKIEIMKIENWTNQSVVFY